MGPARFAPRRGVTWEARYRNSTGKYVYEPCASFEDAKARRAEMANKGHRGEFVANTSLTLNDVLEGWRSWRTVKPRTAQTYDAQVRIHIAPKFGRSRLRDVTRADFRRAAARWLSPVPR